MTSSSSIITSALRSTLQNLARSDQFGTSNSGANSAQSAPKAQAIQDITDISASAQNLNRKASELQSHLNIISRNVAILEGSGQAVKDVTAELRKADVVIGRAIAKLAQDASAAKKSSESDFAVFVKDFNASIAKINDVVASQDAGDVNLLRGDALETRFTGIANTALVTQGADISAEGLGLSPLAAEDFASVSSLATVTDLLRSAIESAKSLEVAFEVDLEEVQTKQDFAAGTVETLLAGYEDLGSYGQADEGANLLAQQASLLLATSDETLVSEEQQSLLNLF